jgi:hypothetical protein
MIIFCVPAVVSQWLGFGIWGSDCIVEDSYLECYIVLLGEWRLTLWRNVGSHSPNDMASHSKRSVCQLKIHESSSWNTKGSSSCGTVHDFYCCL